MNVFVVVAVVGLVAVAAAAVLEKTILVEPISLPKALEERGLSATSVAQTLVDRVRLIYQEANTSKELAAHFGNVSRSLKSHQ